MMVPADPGGGNSDSTSERTPGPDETTARDWPLPPTEALPLSIPAPALPDGVGSDKTTVLIMPGAPALDANLGMTVRDRPPFELPGFEILEKIGQGGMGVVYKAVQKSLNRLVALKLLPRPFADDPQRLSRFRNEARIAAKIDDARVLEIYDVLESEAGPVLVMPFVDGPTLSQILHDRKTVNAGDSGERRHSWSSLGEREYLARVLPVLDQLVEAVAVLHAAGVVHRDVKPSNVLIDAKGQISLCDFGLARLRNAVRVTLGRAELGTRGYMSPEQWEGLDDVDERTDVFSLGATIYHCLTLSIPYGRDRLSDSTPPPAAPSRKRSNLNADFDAVILKAIEPDRRRRYASGHEFREDWNRIREGLLPRFARRATPARQLARWVRRHKAPVAIGLLVGVLIGMIACLWWLWPPERVPRQIRLTTVPVGATVRMVPLDPVDGEPLPERAGPSFVSEELPKPMAMKPGEYLVVARWPDGRFHEVYRHVPSTDEVNPGAFDHLHWRRRPDGVLDLPPVNVPPAGVDQGMAFVLGADEFVLPVDPIGDSKPKPRRVDPFWIDPTEQTVGDFEDARAEMPHRLVSLLANMDPAARRNEAIRHIDFDEAVYEAERRGKRLPDEVEYVFAATNNGTRRFPWGNDPGPIQNGPWKIGPVDPAGFDHTDHVPAIIGLYSNVGEWTTSWISSRHLGLDRVNWPRDHHRMRAVRGIPPSVSAGEPAKPEELEVGPAWRLMIRSAEIWPSAVGVRFARSFAPRFLDDTAGAKPAR